MVAPTLRNFENKVSGMLAYGKDGVTLVPVKVNSDGELIVNLEAATVNIGDVDINSPLGDQHKAAAISVVPADDIPATRLMGKVAIDQSTAHANEVVDVTANQSLASMAASTEVPYVGAENATSRGLISLLKGIKNAVYGKFADLVDGQAPVQAGYKTKTIIVTFTGTGATSQYDAVGTLQEVLGWASAVGRGATLRKMRATCDNNAIAPQFEVHFFKASDVTIAADNASWTELVAEYAKRAGYIIHPTLAKAAGSGTIDFVRSQSDDYGQALNFQVTCGPTQTSLWVGLKLITSGISFAAAPGNAIRVVMEIEQS